MIKAGCNLGCCVSRRKAEFLPTLHTHIHTHFSTLLLIPNINCTCRPMTHCPAFIFSSSNSLSCLSAYFTPMSTRDWQPLVLAWEEKACKPGVHNSSHSLSIDNVTMMWISASISVWFRTLTMLARASSVVWTCVMLPFSNRSLASKMSWGFRP